MQYICTRCLKRPIYMAKEAYEHLCSQNTPSKSAALVKRSCTPHTHTIHHGCLSHDALNTRVRYAYVSKEAYHTSKEMYPTAKEPYRSY